MRESILIGFILVAAVVWIVLIYSDAKAARRKERLGRDPEGFNEAGSLYLDEQPRRE